MSLVEIAQAAGVGSRVPTRGRAGAEVANGKVEDGIGMRADYNGALGSI